MSKKQTPSDFLKQIIGRPVVVKLNNGVDYRGKDRVSLSYVSERLLSVCTSARFCTDLWQNPRSTLCGFTLQEWRTFVGGGSEISLLCGRENVATDGNWNLTFRVPRQWFLLDFQTNSLCQ